MTAPKQQDGRKRPAPKKSSAKKKSKNKNKRTAIVMSCLNIVAIVAIALLFVDSFRAGIQAIPDNYKDAYAAEKDAAYDRQYEKSYQKAEEKYHTHNAISVSIEDIEEVAKLEVLQLYDTEYEIETTDDNDANTELWLKIPGEGCYTVNLQAAEFIIDEDREYVLVRIPYPELSNITIDVENAETLLVESGVFNRDYSTGEDLVTKHLVSAQTKIKKAFESDQRSYKSAQEAARRAVTSLVKQLNPTVTNLAVDVEFYNQA